MIINRAALTIALLLLTAMSHGQNTVSPYSVPKILSVMKWPAPDLVLLSAHRASWQNYPENSLLAVVDVFNRGIETLEVDARMTSDGHVVISHDYTLDRISTGTGLLYSKTWAQVQTYELRDRLGYVYHDSSGNPQRFLDFYDLMLILQGRSDAAVHGYVVIVDIKGGTDPADKSQPMAILQACLQVMNQFGPTFHAPVLQGIVFKMKGKDLPPTVAQFAATPGWSTANSGGLIVVMNPDDPNVTAQGATPANNSFFQTWLAAPFLVHFEMNQFYNGDALQPYMNYLSQNISGRKVGFATYYEPYYFPEGVANSAGVCCFSHSMDTTQPQVDYRGDPAMSVLDRTALVTTDATDALDELLKIRGQRNVLEIE